MARGNSYGQGEQGRRGHVVLARARPQATAEHTGAVSLVLPLPCCPAALLHQDLPHLQPSALRALCAHRRAWPPRRIAPWAENPRARASHACLPHHNAGPLRVQQAGRGKCIIIRLLRRPSESPTKSEEKVVTRGS